MTVMPRTGLPRTGLARVSTARAGSFDTTVTRARPAPRVHLGPRLLVAGGAGLLLTQAFPPAGIWPLAPVAVTMLTLAVRGVRVRTGLLIGLVGGLGFFLLLLDWMRVVGTDAWLALSVVEALYLAVQMGATALVVRLPGWPVWAAALWVVQESVRDRWPLGGFPWGRLAFAETSSPLVRYAALGGAPLDTFVTALVGTLLAGAVLGVVRWRGTHARRPQPGRLDDPGTAAVRAGWLTWGSAGGAVLLVAAGLLVRLPTTGRPLTVAVVQGDVPAPGLNFLGNRPAQVLRNHVAATEALARRIAAGQVAKPAFVVWPEDADDLDPYTNPGARALVDQAVRAVGVPVLVGAVVAASNGPYLLNEGIVWSPTTGPGQTYVKQHLVPFGEYVPWRSVLARYISELSRIPQNFEPGHHPGLLRIGGVPVGDVICYEVAYDGLVRAPVTLGAQVLIVQTNNATYGHTAQPAQQLAISRLRAVEHGRAVLIAATSGITAIIAPNGKILARAPTFTQAELVATIPLRTTLTIADRLGGYPETGLLLLGALPLVWALIERIRGRRGTLAREAVSAGGRPGGDES
ncbi:MAG: apolipoprotein N-acyltransferase [Actinomycetes bacterium]